MVFSLGFSPCPNDTFMFDALIHQKVETFGIRFNPVIEDVQQLNERAINGELDISKMSFFAFANAAQHYLIMNSGSALGNNCGPLLISKEKISAEDLNNCTVAIPGINTTANLLLSIFYPQLKNKTAILFSEIENELLLEKFDAGVIIHENRFTYEQKGLLKIADLGEMWQSHTSQPIPLGCIGIKRNLNFDIQNKIQLALMASIQYAFANRNDVMPFVKQHAQEMSGDVMQQHIGLYVNDFSIDLGVEGQKAICTLFDKGVESGMMQKMEQQIFL